jgi:ABC-2 type transport system permease protein
MTTLIATERIKLLTTRSPWWSTVLALGLTTGFAVIFALNSSSPADVEVWHTQLGYQFGLMVVMVMAALAVTTEYRFSTIRATFLAVPNRTAALLAKTGVVAALALLIGLVAAFGSLAVGWTLIPDANLALNSADAWRMVLGVPLVFTAAAVISVAVGIMLRQSAGAIAVVLIWSMLVENLVSLIPQVGQDIRTWMPFAMTEQFLQGPMEGRPLGPWASFAYFAGVAVALLVAALVVAKKRDA